MKKTAPKATETVNSETAKVKEAVSASEKKSAAGSAKERLRAQRKATRARRDQKLEMDVHNAMMDTAAETAAETPVSEPEKTEEAAIPVPEAEPAEAEYHGEAHKKTDIEVFRMEGRTKVYKTLDELKEEYRHVFGADGAIYQKDILASLEHLDLPDDEMDALWDWFAAENIKVSEDEDIEELEEEDTAEETPSGDSPDALDMLLDDLEKNPEPPVSDEEI